MARTRARNFLMTFADGCVHVSSLCFEEPHAEHTMMRKTAIKAKLDLLGILYLSWSIFSEPVAYRANALVRRMLIDNK